VKATGSAGSLEYRRVRAGTLGTIARSTDALCGSLGVREREESGLPKVQFADRSVECPEGANLRVVLLRARLPLYTRVAEAIHCRGRGLCGTCAVRVEGPVSAPTEAETRRLRRFPHDPGSGLRLACQCSVLGDVVVTKYSGLWGQRIRS
jgi:ferredoxin